MKAFGLKTLALGLAAMILPFQISCSDDERSRATSDSACEMNPEEEMADPKIAAGLNHSAALRSDGVVCTWGGNEYGQLGDGSTTNRSGPVRVANLDEVVMIESGYDHTMAVKSDGTLWAWGRNNRGQIGDGSTLNRSQPVQVGGLNDVISVAAGESHSLAIKSDGTAWAWGANDHGQLGVLAFEDSLVPVEIFLLPMVSEVSSGGMHNLALDNAGNIWSWGFNVDGELGNGTAILSPPSGSIIPGLVGSLSNLEAVAAGHVHSLALDLGGEVWAWGDGTHGQIGDGALGNSSADRRLPVQVIDGDDPSGFITSITKLSAGFSHSLALKSDGTVWAWGNNARGQLGNNAFDSSASPVQALGLVNIIEIAGGGQHSMGLESGGLVWAWGDNQNGQLGMTQSTVAILVPEIIPGIDVCDSC